MQTSECEELFVKFDIETHKLLRLKVRGNERSNLSLQCWMDLLEEDANCAE